VETQNGLDGLAQFADQRGQGQLGIANEADRADHILVEMIRIQRGVDEGLALGELDAEVGLGERAADADDQVGFGDEVVHRFWHRIAAGAKRQGVILREGTLAAQAGGDWSAQQFGDFPQLGPGFRPMHTGAGVDDRPLRLQDRRRRLADLGRVGTVFRCADRGVVDIADFLVPDIGRDFNDCRPAAAVADGAERAAQDVADFLGQRNRFGQLRDPAHLPHGIVVGIDVGDATGIALRDHQHRNGFGVSLRHAAIGVLGAGTVLHAERADLSPGRHAGDGVRHVQANALLTHDNRPYVCRRGELQQVIDRIATQDLDPFALHDLRNSLTDFHPPIS
jgi:hypothetical protein